MQNFAPIALFVYNRPEHTRRTLKFLQKNDLAEESRLFIFSDGARAGAEEQVNAVRELAKSITGFKSVEVIEREYNYGLANSVIEGVSRLTKAYGRAIVLEDDVLTSRYTLQYFNDALNKYNDVEKVMHVTAYMYPIAHEKLPETFFLRLASSQAWATWDRAWQYFEPDIDKTIARFDDKLKHQFELEGGMNFWKHVMEFKHGRNNSWAIRWYASVFLNKGLSVNPALSLIENIGHDGSGVHSGVSTIYKGAINNFRITEFPAQLEEYKPGYQEVRRFLKHRKGTYIQRGLRYLNHVFTKMKMKYA
jgi:hypoxanthine phosphoribosyltransferase